MNETSQTIMAWSFLLSVMMSVLFASSVVLRLVESGKVAPQTDRAILVRLGLVLLSLTLMTTSLNSVIEIDNILVAMVALTLRGFAIALGFTLNVYEIQRIRRVRAAKRENTWRQNTSRS